MKTLLYTGIILLILSSCTSKTTDKSESDRNDSIRKYLDLAGDSSIAFDKRILYNDKAYSMIDLNKNDTITFSLLYKTTLNFCRLNESEKLKITSSLMLKKAQLSKKKHWIALSYKMLGLYYMNISENEKALYYYFAAKKLFISLNQYKEIINVLFNISLTQSYAGDFLGSNKTCFEVLQIEKVHKGNLRYGIVFNQIANNLSELKQENKAIEYYNKINKKRVNLDLKFSIFNNISASNIELGEYRKANNLLDSILKDKTFKIIAPNSYATALSLLGYSSLKMNNLKGLSKVFFKADEIYKNSKTLNGRNYNYIYLSMYYEKINDTNNAILVAKKAYNLSKEFKNPSDILKSLQQLIKVDKDNTLKHTQEYIRINDSMQTRERRFRDKYAQIEYETDEITHEKDKAINQKWIISGILVVIILVISLLLIITRQRAKQKELQLLQSQQKANEEIYDLMLLQKTKEEEARQSEKKRIAIELHDGVMNRLASTRFNLDILYHKTDEATIKECLIYIDDIYKIEQEIRNISHDLTYETYANYSSFTVLINDFLMSQNKISGCDFKLEMDESINWEILPSTIKMNLFRIIQEASHNINKFSQAKNAIISFVIDNTNLCLSVSDDGIGFDTNQQNEGIGLKNIKQRVESLNGKFTIQSTRGKNTSINIAIPIQ